MDHQGSGNLTCIEGLQTSPVSETDGSEEAQSIQNTGMKGFKSYRNQNKKNHLLLKKMNGMMITIPFLIPQVKAFLMNTIGH